MDKSNLNDLASKLADAVPRELIPDDLLPEDLKLLRDELRDNFRSLLGAGLEQLDLVTREEFDVQRKVLERTREKLDRLEKELAELQARGN